MDQTLFGQKFAMPLRKNSIDFFLKGNRFLQEILLALIAVVVTVINEEFSEIILGLLIFME